MASADTAPAPLPVIKVEVAYARPDVQVILPVEVVPGTTIKHAIHASGILERFPEIDLPHCRVAVFGRLSKLEHVLRAGERAEILRPLIADPKQVRKRRAAEAAAPATSPEAKG